MPLEAVLTVGWPDIQPGELAATALHEDCLYTTSSDYSKRLLQQLNARRHTQPMVIKGTEGLFRRRANDFSRIKTFMGTLHEVVRAHPELGTIHCEIDAFAYAFLQGAKNFDFLLPESRNQTGLFRQKSRQWRRDIVALERFERDGRPLGARYETAYLDLRRIVARKSARDERRTLATLLVSGPSTLDEVKTDLGLSYDLAGRILTTLQSIDVLVCPAERYRITLDALPRVVFCLREVMGFDLLAVLDRGK